MAGEKVSELLSEYGLGDYGEELERRWTHPDPARRKSVRELTSELNAKIVERTIERRTDGYLPVTQSPEKIAQILKTGVSDATEHDRVNATDVVEFQNWLSESDIDPERLRKDLVSYVTLHSYLKEQREAESPRERPDLTVEQARAKKTETIREMRDKYARYLQDRFEPLRNRNLLPESTPEIFVEFNVSCPKCGARHSAIEYIDNQGCTECDEHTRDLPTDGNRETLDTDESESETTSGNGPTAGSSSRSRHS